MPVSTTIAGRAGQRAFTAPFPVAAVTVGGSDAPFTAAPGGFNLNTPLAADGVVVASGGYLGESAGGGVAVTGPLTNAELRASAIAVRDEGAADGVVRAPETLSAAAAGASFSTVGYGAVLFQVTANASSNTIVVEGSADGGTTWSIIAFRFSGTTGSTAAVTAASATGSNAILIPTVVMPLMRWRVSTFVSGSTTVAVALKRDSTPNVVDASVSNKPNTTPSMNSGGNLSVQTATTGTNYTAFGAQACSQVTIVNDTGTKIEVRQGATGVALPIPDGSIVTFFGLTNTNQLDVRRSDTSNTQVTVRARWEA